MTTYFTRTRDLAPGDVLVTRAWTARIDTLATSLGSGMVEIVGEFLTSEVLYATVGAPLTLAMDKAIHEIEERKF